MQPTVISGQRVAITMNQMPYAFGTVLDYSIDTQVSEIVGIDSMLPLELTPDRLRVTMSIRIFRTIDNDPSTDGKLFQQAFRQEDQQQAFAEKGYVTIEIRDRVTDKTLMYIPRALVSNRSANVGAEDLMTETWTIVGIGFQGQEDQGLLKSLGFFKS